MVKKNKLRNIAALSGVGIGLAVTGQAILAEECESESIPNSIETSPMNELEMTEAVYVDESKEDSAVPEVKTVAEELPVNELVEEKERAEEAELEEQEPVSNVSGISFGAAAGENAAISSGVYTISSAVSTGQVLDVNAGATYNGANVQIYENNDSGAQIWRVDVGSDGYYTFTNIIVVSAVSSSILP